MTLNACEVSIIIVNYNTFSLLKGCIESIYRETKGISYEIIVIDNHSKERQIESLCSLFPEVTLILSDINAGFGRANNKGAGYAKGSYLFFLNPDTVLMNDAITLLYRFISTHPQTGICGANLFDSNRQPNLSYFKFPTFGKELKALFSSKQKIQSIFNFTASPLRVDCISGADVMIKKELFDQLNGFDPDFFMYFEETELTYRVHQRHYQVFSVPEARIIHYQGMSNPQYSQKINTQFLLSKFLFFKKVYGPSYPKQIKSLLLAKGYLAYFIYSLLRNKQKINYWKTKSQIIREVFQQYLLITPH